MSIKTSICRCFCCSVVGIWSAGGSPAFAKDADCDWGAGGSPATLGRRAACAPTSTSRFHCSITSCGTES
ncbi:MAG: hypothetical protein IIU11_09330 [Bacteroidales bacterium]|nr:hypothetical protein [Bacteroidales bacterium]